jgi:hypothetical protein
MQDSCHVSSSPFVLFTFCSMSQCGKNVTVWQKCHSVAKMSQGVAKMSQCGKNVTVWQKCHSHAAPAKGYVAMRPVILQRSMKWPAPDLLSSWESKRP